MKCLEVITGSAKPIDLKPGGGSKSVRIGDTTIDYGISRDGRTADLILIKTPRKKRGGGSARRALEQFLQAMDDAGFTVFLLPRPMDRGIDQDRLIRLYASFGFVPEGDRMVRYPMVKLSGVSPVL